MIGYNTILFTHRAWVLTHDPTKVLGEAYDRNAHIAHIVHW